MSLLESRPYGVAIWDRLNRIPRDLESLLQTFADIDFVVSDENPG